MQQLAAKVFQVLSKLDADIVWLTLARVIRPRGFENDRHLPSPDPAYDHWAKRLLDHVEVVETCWGE